MVPAVKFVDGSETELEGLLLPYGGLHNGADLYGERFTKSTDFCLEWSNGGQLPLLFQHGLDPAIETEVVGRIKGITFKADGGWMQAQLDASAKYFEQISQLVKAGKLFLSSGAMAHLVKVSKSGDIERWPTVEGSMTPTPANLLAKLDFATASRHYKSAGIDLPDSLKAEMSTDQRNQLTDADFAYIDSEGGRHLPMNDAAHARNAIARFNQTQFESEDAKAEARRKLIARAKELGIEVSEDSMKAVSMARMKEMAAEMDMEMSDAEMTRMMDGADSMTEADMKKRLSECKAQKAAPVLKFSDLVSLVLDDPGLDPEPVPIGFHAEAVTTLAASLLERTKGLHERRLKEGRMLSGANRKRLSQCVEAMNAAVTELQGLLDSSEPQTAKAASLRRLRATLIAQQIEAMTLT